ncbi:hypothetical protein [Halosegnis marinus]|uniref:hypothetical protein n=1 Tax=Halosegnis marinus TaxID=3034023 RepID=UPI00361CB644
MDDRSRVTELDVRPEFDRRKLAYRILIGQPAVFFRNEVVKTHRLDTSLQFCMDYEYWLRISEEFDVRHVRDVFSGFRRHEQQKTEDMDAVSVETEDMLSRYRDSFGSSVGSTVLANTYTEATRFVLSLYECLAVSARPPELAFDGEIAPFTELLSNLGPSVADVRKAWRRRKS